MVDNKLSGSHINRTLAYLTIPEFRSTYLSSLHTDSQRRWARQLLINYENGQLRNLNLVPGQDSVCARCQPLRQSECIYMVDPLILGDRVYPFGETSIAELLERFDPNEFMQEETRKEEEFRNHLMQHM